MPPLNLVGDFGGGSMFLLLGILSALWERQTSGKGQVVDAAMVDGSSVLVQMIGRCVRRECGPTSEAPTCSTAARPTTTPTSAPTAATSPSVRSSRSSTRPCWPDWVWIRRLAGAERRHPLARIARVFTQTFASHDRDQWAKVFAESDACVTPVLSFGEVETEPHIAERHTFYEMNGGLQPRPAPRFSRTAPETPRAAAPADIEAILGDWV